MEYYSVMEMNEILPFATMCMDLGCCSQNSRVKIQSAVRLGKGTNGVY